MIDPFDAALSEFIDTLPEDPDLARHLLVENAPFAGRGDLPEFAQLATMLRSVAPHQPRAEWAAASKARLMAAPLLPPEKRGFTWLGTMFLPFSQLSFPSISLPRLSMPSPVFARAAMALVLVATLASVAHKRAGQNPILQVTSDQAPVQDAQQAIAATQQQVARLADSQSQVAGVDIQGTPRDVVLLSQQIDLADLAIDKAPTADQPRLRAQLQSVVRAVRFDGLLEGITNGSTLQVSGVAVQADPSLVQQLQVGQPVSLLVTVNSSGKLQAVQVAPTVAQSAPASVAPAPSHSSSPAPSVPSSSSSASSPPPPAGGGTAPLTSSSNINPAVDRSSTAAPLPTTNVSTSVSNSQAGAESSEENAHKPAKKSDDDGSPGATTSRGGGGTAASTVTAPAPTANGAPASVTAAATTPGTSGQGATVAGSTTPGATNVTVTTTTSGEGGDKRGKSDVGNGSGKTSAVAGATTSSQVTTTVTTGSSSGGSSGSSSAQTTSSSSQSSNSSSHNVSVSVSSNNSSSSSGQQSSSSQSSQSSNHGGSSSAQVSRALAALQTTISSTEDHGKRKGDKRG